MAKSDKYKQAVMRKLTKELGNFSEAAAYFENNKDFEPTIEEKTAANTCAECGEKYVSDVVFSCEACNKTYASKSGITKTASDEVLCPVCDSPMDTVDVVKCACGIKPGTVEASIGDNKKEAATKLAAYLGRHKKLNKEASKMVSEASEDEDIVAWGDCIVDQYTEGYSLGESVAICGCIKREVLASIEDEVEKRKVSGTTKVAFDGSNFMDVDEIDENEDKDIIELEVKFEFDPVTEELSIISTEVETENKIEDEIEDEDEIEEVMAPIEDEDEVGFDDDEEVEEVSDKIPGVPAQDGSGGGVGQNKEKGIPGVPSGEGPGKDSPECIINEDEIEENIEPEENEIEETEFDVPDFDDAMIAGTNLDIDEESKKSMTEDEIHEARKARVQGLLKRAEERQASLDVTNPSDDKALGNDTSNDPQANNTEGSAPKITDESGTHKPEPKKEVVNLDGENSLAYQNDLIELNLPQIPTQRQLELQTTAVPQKERQVFEGEPTSEQMNANDPSYNLDEPEIPVSKTTPHDNEDYSQEELDRPKVPTQTDGGRFENEFVTAEDEETRKVLAEQEKKIENLRRYAAKAKKASRVANELLNAGVIDEAEYDDRVEVLASMTDEHLNMYVEQITNMQKKYNSKTEAENHVESTEITAASEGATSILAVPNEQAVEVDNGLQDGLSSLAASFSIGQGKDAQKAIPMDEFKKMQSPE
jgi:hypothetical protein